MTALPLDVRTVRGQKKYLVISLACLTLLALAYAFLGPINKVAAACTDPAAPYGTLTLDNDTSTSTTSVIIPSDGNYRFWARIQAPDTTNNSFIMNIDGTQCQIKVGDNASMPTNSWQWVNYRDGNTTSLLTFNLSAGAHQVKLFGNEADVKVDRILFLSDTSCVPTSKGDNCADSGTVDSKAIYRLVRTNSGKHAFTAIDSQRDSIKAEGYVDDGRPFNVSTTQQPGMVPVYSMYNGRFDDRWLLLDGMNRYWGVVYGGYRDDGIVFYAYPANPSSSSNACNTGKPVYQMWHGGLFDHFYTTNTGDRVWGILSGGYIDDNSASYRNPSTGNVSFCAL